MNRYDESRSPCLRSLPSLKLSVLPPLIRTSNEIEEMQDMIQLVNVWLIPDEEEQLE